jgi:hypothetical protein
MAIEVGLAVIGLLPNVGRKPCSSRYDARLIGQASLSEKSPAIEPPNIGWDHCCLPLVEIQKDTLELCAHGNPMSCRVPQLAMKDGRFHAGRQNRGL